MSGQEVSQIGPMQARLRLLEEQFEREMRERGFEPSQADNVPLTSSLAKLYNEQEQLRAELALLTDDQKQND